MSSEQSADPDRRGRKHWYLWILAGGLFGAIFGPTGMCIGGIIEGLVVILVNCTPGGHRWNWFLTVMILGLGPLVGLMVGMRDSGLKDNLFGKPGPDFWAVLGLIIALCDRIFVWVAFPEAAAVSVEAMDDPDRDLQTDNSNAIHPELED